MQLSSFSKYVRDIMIMIGESALGVLCFAFVSSSISLLFVSVHIQLPSVASRPPRVTFDIPWKLQTHIRTFLMHEE